MNLSENAKVLIVLASPFYLEKGSSVRARSDIVAWASYFKNIDLLAYPVGNELYIENVNHIKAKVPFYKKASAGPSLSKIYADILMFFHACSLTSKNKYELIIGEDFEGAFIGKIIAKIFRKKYIYSMYNPLEENIKPYTSKKIILKISKAFDKFLEKGTKNITLEWEYEKERVDRMYPGKNTAFLPDAFPAQKDDKEPFNVDNYIFYAGNFKEYQGVPFFLRSFKKYIENGGTANLVLAGANFDEMKKYSEDLNLGKKVTFTGSLGLARTNYMIGRSLFCILPRVVDGPPGMKALHYFSQGKPILGTDLSCNSKLIINEKSGILVPMNEDEMAKGIKKMVEDTKLRASLEEYIKVEKIGKQERANEGVLKIVSKII